MGKARMMLHIGVDHSNNCQILLQLFEHDIFCYNLQHKKVSSKFEGIRGINHLRYKYEEGQGRVMLHIGAGHSNNCQIILQLFVHDIFYNYLWHKKI